MAEEETTREGARARTPEEVRPKGQASIAQMTIIGAIASALGIVLGLIIDWFPTSASTQASKIDTLYDVLMIVSVPVFVLVTVVVLFSVWKFRMRPGEELADGPPIHGNTRLEVIWTAIPAIVLVALCTYAYVTLTDVEEAKANEMRINVIGQQFAWTFEYPQNSGQPIRSTQLYLPKDRPVHFFVKSRDVIHDFWVPAFRMKVDAVPGIETKYRITPNKLGDYPVVCAELCGLGHALMRQTAHVVTPAAFTAWVQKQKQPAQNAGGGGGGSTGGGTVDAKAIFTQGAGAATACGACHTLSDAGTSASTGPNLDDGLKGRDAAFIKQSIEQPNAQIAQGYSAGIMPQNYAQTLSPAQIDALVKYLQQATGG
jgi:cytochrome c oxidase subunit II